MFKANDNHHLLNLFDTSTVMHEKVKKKLESSFAPIFYETVFKNINEKPFEVLYSNIERPNFPVNYLMCLEFIKYMQDSNNIEIINAYHYDYLVGTALVIKGLGEVYMTERRLYYFRKRLYIYLLEHPEDEELLFGTFIKLLKEFAKEASINLEFQRTDTTLFTSNIKKAGRLSLAYDVLRLAVKSIPENKLTQKLEDTKKDSFKTELLYRTRTNDTDTKLSLVLSLCKEAKDILAV